MTLSSLLKKYIICGTIAASISTTTCLVSLGINSDLERRLAQMYSPINAQIQNIHSYQYDRDTLLTNLTSRLRKREDLKSLIDEIETEIDRNRNFLSNIETTKTDKISANLNRLGEEFGYISVKAILDYQTKLEKNYRKIERYISSKKFKEKKRLFEEYITLTKEISKQAGILTGIFALFTLGSLGYKKKEENRIKKFIKQSKENAKKNEPSDELPPLEKKENNEEMVP